MVLLPLQIVLFPLIEIVGVEFTVTVVVPVFEQLTPSVTKQEYVSEETGDARGTGTLELLSPVPGVQA